MELHPEIPWFSLYLGTLEWDDSDVAEHLYRQAAAGFEKAGDLENEVKARNALSTLLFRLGRLGDAGAQAERVYKIAGHSSNRELAAEASLVLARSLAQRNEDLARVEELLYGSRRIGAGSPCIEGKYATRRDCLITLGNVESGQGHLVEARAAFRALLGLTVEAGDLFAEAAARYGLMRVATEKLTEEPSLRRRNETVRLAREALVAARAAKNQSIEAKAAWTLGVLVPGLEGQKHLRECREHAATIRDKSYCLSALARRSAASDPAEAERLMSRAVALARKAEDPFSQAFAERERMRMAWTLEPPQKAMADSWAALDAIETLRDLQPKGSDVQAGLFSTWADDYLWLSGRLLRAAKEGKVDPEWAEARAFEVTERMRARSLIDDLRAAKVEPKGPPARAGDAFATLAAVRRALAPDEALLSFQVAPSQDLSGEFGGGSWVTTVTRGGVWIDPLPDRGDLRQVVHVFAGLFAGPAGREEAQAVPAVRLYQRLLAPAISHLPPGVQRLILIPDDALRRLPFDALRPALGQPPLGVRYGLSRVPSATLWFRWRREAAPRALRAALVLADPTSPRAAAELALAPLAHARSEGWEVAHALGRGSSLLEGDEASEAALETRRLNEFGILHLATHAVTDEAHPERSAVVLASSGSSKGAADGLLRASEIARLHLDGQLVVLGSCRSAGGQMLRGEGVMSLARAFFQAGARTVVASLWPVRDDYAEALFARFYDHLAQGATVADSLRLACRDRIAAGAPPAAWAGFVVLGDGDAKPVPTGGPRLAWVWPWLRAELGARGAAWVGLAAAGLLLGLAALLVRRGVRGARRRGYSVFHTTR